MAGVISARGYAITKAMELQDTLGSSHPSFVKSMVQSNVTGPFCLGIPAQFCRKHLPSRDERIRLVDEEGEEIDAIYLARRTGITAGWKTFALDHGLVDGDCLVFEFIKPRKLKVHIIRQNAYHENNV